MLKITIAVDFREKMGYNTSVTRKGDMEDFEVHERGTASELYLLRALARACTDAKAWGQTLPVDVNEAVAQLKQFYGKKSNGETL